LGQWAATFPDPRAWSEISSEVIIASEVAARFASIYSQRKSSYVLRSARVLGALGYSVEVLEEGSGLSGRGTQGDSLYSEDVLRKLLGKLEQEVEVSDQDWAAAIPGGAAVKVRAPSAAPSSNRNWMSQQRRPAHTRWGWHCATGITSRWGLGG